MRKEPNWLENLNYWGKLGGNDSQVMNCIQAVNNDHEQAGNLKSTIYVHLEK